MKIQMITENDYTPPRVTNNSFNVEYGEDKVCVNFNLNSIYGWGNVNHGAQPHSKAIIAACNGFLPNHAGDVLIMPSDINELNPPFVISAKTNEIQIKRRKTANVFNNYFWIGEYFCDYIHELAKSTHGVTCVRFINIKIYKEVRVIQWLHNLAIKLNSLGIKLYFNEET